MVRVALDHTFRGFPLLLGLLVAVGCGPAQQEGAPGALEPPTSAAPGNGDLAALMKARGLSEQDVEAALRTYTPTGGRDEYLLSPRAGTPARCS